MRENLRTNINSKIVAFIFNNRADVLRDELYRAVCLHVLSSATSPITLDELIFGIASEINPNAEVNESLRILIIDEVKHLIETGFVIHENQKYIICEEQKQSFTNNIEEKELNKVIHTEISIIAKEINPKISNKHINMLFDFYLAACDIVAKERVASLVKNNKLDVGLSNSEDFCQLIDNEKEKYRIDEIINCTEFINKCFINPTKELSNYEFVFIQVNIIMELLAWDPALEYLKNNVLKGKTLYLDSSALFPILLKTHGLHDFITCLLKATREELGVHVRIHENTIREYENVIKSLSDEFYNQQRTLRQLSNLARTEKADLKEYLDNQVFVDYLTNNPEHIDLGSWQRYANSLRGENLFKVLSQLGIYIDKQNSFVPSKDFEIIKENIIKASRDQVYRGKRLASKNDATHDAQLFNLIIKNRRRLSGGLSFGYDTYLFTLDGSLVHFIKYQGLTWTDTYFIFPTQWYELAFPFLRMTIRENPNITKSFSSLAFSSLFPKLENVIPIELFGYVFDNGGIDLSLRTVKEVVESLIEQRLEERLDPSNKNIKEREEAQLTVQRIIAEKTIKEKKLVQKLTQEQKELEKKKSDISSDISKSKSELQMLQEEAMFKEAELEALTRKLQTEKNITDIYKTNEEIKTELEIEKEKEKKEISLTHSKEMLLKNAEIEGLKGTIQELNIKIQNISKSLEFDKKEKEIQFSQLKNKKKRFLEILIEFVAFIGIGVIYYLLNTINISSVFKLSVVVLMLFGAILYEKKITILGVVLYSIGVLISGVILLIQEPNERLLFLIPAGWELLLFAIDRANRSNLKS